jgi:5-methylthioadenosine/S-adenosylhomocysteine deaminase
VNRLLIRGGTVLTMNDDWDVVTGDVAVEDGRIVSVGGAAADPAPGTTIIDAAGSLVMPGFVQTHVHLCQTLFRGMADDLTLLEWLQYAVWPLEAAHDARSLRAAARLAAAELQLGGTTTVLTMETVHDTDAVFEAIEPTGLRAAVGKCLMDVRGDAPGRLVQTTRDALDESLALHARWTGQAGGRLRAALAPRFAVSCSRELLEAAADASERLGLLVHTHASEQREEAAVVKRQTGLDNIEYLESVGLASERLCVAHCVWPTDAEMAMLAERQVRVLHCPSSNLKLGSGIAPVARMRATGIRVSLGADGAACNNTLNMFQEMRLAAMVQSIALGPGALTARDAVWMATREGARALGLEAEIGSVEPGKKADLIVVGTGAVHQLPGPDPYSLLVYASRPSDVQATIVDGEVVARAGALAWADLQDIAGEAREAGRALAGRAGV